MIDKFVRKIYILCICCCSFAKLCPTVCNHMDCSTPGFPVLHYLVGFVQIHVHVSMMPSSHLILCYPLLLPSVFPSIRVFSSELALRIRWAKYWSFSFSISPSNEYSGLISFRVDWLDLLAAQGILKSLLQHHSSNASVLQCSAFFMVKLLHPYMSVSRFSRSVVSESFRPYGLQKARLPCPSPTPGAYSNSCLLNWWCHPTISSSVVTFSSRLPSFPASGSFPVSQFFTSGG